MSRVNPRLEKAIYAKYRGLAIYDFRIYLACRANIAQDFCVEHFLNLKAHYRKQFLNNPRRKGA